MAVNQTSVAYVYYDSATLYRYLRGDIPKSERLKMQAVIRNYPCYLDLLDDIEKIEQEYGESTLDMLQPDQRYMDLTKQIDKTSKSILSAEQKLNAPRAKNPTRVSRPIIEPINDDKIQTECAELVGSIN